MSELIDELFEAANCLENDKLHRLAARLRQRAARVRETIDLVNTYRFGGGPRELVRDLTGPIPAAETAPTERKEP